MDQPKIERMLRLMKMMAGNRNYTIDELAEKLGPEYCVAAVGLDKNQIEALPKNTVMGIRRTGNINDLCALYTAADVYVSVSAEETFGMTAMEARCCGTEAIVYKDTACEEIVNRFGGIAVERGAANLYAAIEELMREEA